MAHTSDQIRNFALVGHGHAGKTALLDALGSGDWSRGSLPASAIATVFGAAGLMTVIDGRLRTGPVLQSAPGSFARSTTPR